MKQLPNIIRVTLRLVWCTINSYINMRKYIWCACIEIIHNRNIHTVTHVAHTSQIPIYKFKIRGSNCFVVFDWHHNTIRFVWNRFLIFSHIYKSALFYVALVSSVRDLKPIAHSVFFENRLKHFFLARSTRRDSIHIVITTAERILDFIATKNNFWKLHLIFTKSSFSFNKLLAHTFILK